jgi:16S rRNA (adenine1518-N6/adenine1519-N6)-dimethyltransferase
MHVARKRFGQHFLHDKNVIEQIVVAINPQAGEHLVEIGPGQGALTLPLLTRIPRLDVVELDRDLIPILKSRCENKGDVIIHQADALRFDYSQLVQDNQPLRLVGNLPYNISTPLIFHLLTYANQIIDMHFMLQKEVSYRLAAPPGDDTYGRLSVMVQYHCQVNVLFHIGPAAFNPPPQVDSCIVHIAPYEVLPNPATDYLHFAELVKTAFSQRRKTLRNCLKTMVSDTDWALLPIDPKARPQELSVADFVNMSNLLVATHGNVCDR